MKRTRSILDVARHAGVSSATVSRVLSGAPVVSEATQAKVLAAVKELGFYPNHMAQGLRRGHSNTVGLLVGDIEQGVYASLTKQIQPALEAHGLELLLYNLGHSHERLEKILMRTASLRLHGIVIATSDQLTEQTIHSLSSKVKEEDLPVIAVGLPLNGHGIPSIVYNDRAATGRSTEYLVKTYQGPAAYVGRISGSVSGEQRYLGYLDGLARQQINADSALIWDASYRYKAGFESVSRALKSGVKFRSIQTGSDELAMGAMAAVHAHGLTIPDDVAVVGIGDLEASAYANPPLTTHGASPDLVAHKVADILRQFREGANVDMITQLPRRFIRRKSA